MSEPVHRYELTALERRVERLEEARRQESEERWARSKRNGWILTGAIWLVAYSALLVTVVVSVMENN